MHLIQNPIYVNYLNLQTLRKVNKSLSNKAILISIHETKFDHFHINFKAIIHLVISSGRRIFKTMCVRDYVSGLPFGLFKGEICQIWPFLKLFARNKMVWPFGHFLAFFEC